ncbi:hypothetical protein GPECTOR_21g605 [Gonium pectorale]|uniref:Uncharacterized protein n=1 Tax=Gonium pectorale TaxID=33097 RepID=A0A150GHV3_GONPE|nr:hypothetical protein GPECTOR_21g605 [Gonium pectorale]|eukprot:KXZ49379.1 hypothetical protein GPECTOR_21g605 [Gonium pectorale]
MAVLLLSAANAARPMSREAMEFTETLQLGKRHGDRSPFRTPAGLFIQERASKQLPGPGQHFSFGALVGWDRIHQLLDNLPNSKLIFVIRHGQAVSNYLSDALGPDEWFKWESKCAYNDNNGTEWGIFDADLTALGSDEAHALNRMLKDGAWFNTLTAGKQARAIVSPLSRCLETASIALKDITFTATQVEENVRETLGEDTCDARRSASDPSGDKKDRLEGVCKFELGLESKFPDFDFPITPPIMRGAEGGQEGVEGGRLGSGSCDPEGPTTREGFGLLADRDPLWTDDRETQDHQVNRALCFLRDLWAFAPERVVFVVSHSGFARSLLLAVGREPYRPQNTELVPVLVQRVV